VFLIFLIVITILGILTFTGVDQVIGKYLESLAFESDSAELETPQAEEAAFRLRKLLLI